MLSDHPATAALPAQDYDRAVRFYKERLEMTPGEEGPDGATFNCGEGTAILVFPSSGAPSGDHT